MQIVRSSRNADNVPLVVNINMADSQTIKDGDLIQVNATSKLGEAAVASSTSIIGIANNSITTTTATSADVLSITKVAGEVVRMVVSQAGTKKTFASTDKYLTAFNLLNKTTIAPDNTTNGMCYVQGYDNTQNTVDVIFAAANLANIG